MSKIRTDRYKVGDTVYFSEEAIRRDEETAAHEPGILDYWGDGPLRVVAVKDIDPDRVTYAGHTQHLTIAADEPVAKGAPTVFSGVYFKPLRGV